MTDPNTPKRNPVVKKLCVPKACVEDLHGDLVLAVFTAWRCILWHVTPGWSCLERRQPMAVHAGLQCFQDAHNRLRWAECLNNIASKRAAECVSDLEAQHYPP